MTVPLGTLQLQLFIPAPASMEAPCLARCCAERAAERSEGREELLSKGELPAEEDDPIDREHCQAGPAGAPSQKLCNQCIDTQPWEWRSAGVCCVPAVERCKLD